MHGAAVGLTFSSLRVRPIRTDSSPYDFLKGISKHALSYTHGHILEELCQYQPALHATAMSLRLQDSVKETSLPHGLLKKEKN